MIKLKARRILEHPVSELWDLLKGSEIEVEFDDGTLVMTATDIILSAHAWFYYLVYPSLPMSVSGTVNPYLKDGNFAKNTYVDINQFMLWYTVDKLKEMGTPIDRVAIFELVNMMDQ